MRMTRLESLRAGPPLLAADGRCAPLLTVCAAVLIVAVSILAGQVAVSTTSALAYPGAALPQPAATVLFLLAMQVTMVMLTLVAAGLDRVPVRERLVLAPSPKGAAASVEAVAGVIAFVALYTAVVYASGLTDIVTDLKPFIGLIQSPVWPLAVLAVAVGAPLSEEILFRGYLLPALVRSRLGIRGAALLSTLAWTALHAGYSMAGMAEVFLIGLYLCWLVWRTGSLRPPLLCHVAVNSLTLALIALLPLVR